MDRGDLVESDKTTWKHLNIELQRRCVSLNGSEEAVSISHALKISTWTSDSVSAWLINKDQSLAKAVKGGKLAVCQGLLEAGAKADDNESQALRLAAAAGNQDMCQLLLSQPNNLARADAENSWALVKAAYDGHLEVYRLLLSLLENSARADVENSRV